MDLEEFFSMGGSAMVSAQNTFANRRAELEAFFDSLKEQSLDDPLGVVEDLRSPRRNILVFFGIGGVGKTRLSRELENRFVAGKESSEDRVSFRVDFDAGGSSGLEGILLGLRGSLGRCKAVWPAFDLAFAVYWEKAHPGIPLQAAVNNSSAARRVAGQLDLGTQLQAAIEDLLDSPGGVLGIFTTSARLLGRSVKQRLTERRLMGDCPFFAPIVEENNPATIRSYLGSLLAWDLAQYQRHHYRRGQLLRVAVFFDTWERVQEGAPYRGNTEDLLARLVHLMPNALFVITGRNQLRWADEESRAVMQWAGPEHWPYLADAVSDVEPRQHLVGGLSPEDADRFLRRRLITKDDPAIPDPVREVIIDAAGGLPLYLDLAALRFAQLAASGTQPAPVEFGHPFPEVVMNLMKDLEPDQRCLLRIAAIVHRFDEDLLLAGVPQLSDSSVSRFIRRPLVRRDSGEHAPFSIHESLREAVQTCDIAEDRWSTREWAQAIERLLAEIHRRVQPELGASGTVDVSLLTGFYMEGIGLAIRQESIPPWLWQLAGRLHSLGAWEVLTWTDSATPTDNALRSAAVGLAAIGQRNERGPAATASTLQACLADPRLDTTGRDYISYWLAWMLDQTDRWDEAEQVRLEVAAGRGPFIPYVRHALGRSDWVCGRLARALSWEFDEHDPLQRFWKTGLHGRVAWILGRFEEAEALLASRLDAAEQIGAPELVAHSLRTRGELRCFTTPGDVTDSTEAATIYSRVASSVSEAEALASIAVSRAGLDPLNQVIDRLDPLRSPLQGGPHADVAEVFIRCIYGDVAGAQQARERLSTNRHGRAYGFWVPITGWWISELSDSDEQENPADVEWLHGEEDARLRWVAVLNARRLGG